MALLKKSLTRHVFGLSRINNPALTNCRTSSSRTAPMNHQSPSNKRAPDPGEDGIFRRFFHRQSVASAAPSGLGLIPSGEKLLEKLRGMDIAKDRIRLDGLRPPCEEQMTVTDAKKIIKLSQLEKVKSRLRMMEKDLVSYPEFLEICIEECSSVSQGMEFAKMLDESGGVIVLGNVVFIRPEQVVKAIQTLMPVTLSSNPHDPRMQELQELEKQKLAIDMKAGKQVKGELLCGLGYLVVQTAVFMRLTFWELSWDVMEPICFYVTSIYFMAGYVFFLRTAQEPSFEGFFKGRVGAKQKRMMKARNFDVERYNELRKIFYPKSYGTMKSSFTFTGSHSSS